MGAEDISILEKFIFDSYRRKFTNRSDLQPPWDNHLIAYWGNTEMTS